MGVELKREVLLRSKRSQSLFGPVVLPLQLSERIRGRP